MIKFSKKMKITICFFLITGFFIIPLLSDSNQSSSKKESSFFMKNGMGVFIQNRDHIPLTNIVFAINMGSKDENENTGGIVHLLEHLLLFGGTVKHSSSEINRQMRVQGVQLNAHTSHDMMTFEVSVPSQNWEFALHLLKDKLFNYQFSKEMLDREREIIFEEINQHQNDPFFLGTHLVLQNLFKNHSYHHPIFGTLEVINKVSLKDIEKFYRCCVVPDKCSIAVVGDINIRDIEKKVKETLGGINTVEEKIKSKADFQHALPLQKNIEIIRYLDIKEANLIFGFYAPPTNHPDQLGFDILKIILGRGIQPLLSSALIKRGKPLTYNIYTRYIGLQYGGAFLIYCTLDPKNIVSVKRMLLKFFKTLWKFNFSKDDYPSGNQLYITDYLEAAKSQIKYSFQQFQELGLNAATTYAKYLLYFKELDRENQKQSLEPYMTRVDKTTSSDIKDIAARYLSGKKYVMVSILPEKFKKKKEKK